MNGKTRPDNVCAAAVDIDGDGLPELVLGSAWKPFDTANAAQMSWLKRGKSLDDEWTMHELPCDEPMVHRVRVFDIDGDGKPEIVMVPLDGPRFDRQGELDGRPPRADHRLQDPREGPGEEGELEGEGAVGGVARRATTSGRLIQEGRLSPDILITSYEGVYVISAEAKDKWSTTKLAEGNQANPKGSRGASEIKYGHIEKNGPTTGPVIATIEPWHGNQVVTYTTSNEKRKALGPPRHRRPPPLGPRGLVRRPRWRRRG